MIPPSRNWLTSSFRASSSSLLKPVGKGAFVVISMMYRSELRLLHNLPILSHREPSTSKLKRRVSSPRLTLKKAKKQSYLTSYQVCRYLRKKIPVHRLLQLRVDPRGKNPSTPKRRNREYLGKVRSLCFLLGMINLLQFDAAKSACKAFQWYEWASCPDFYSKNTVLSVYL